MKIKLLTMAAITVVIAGCTGGFRSKDMSTGFQVDSSMMGGRIGSPTTSTGLKATPLSFSEIDLTWLAASVTKGKGNISSYIVFRNGAQVASVPASQLIYKDINLSPSTTYSYQVASVASSGQQSALSGSVSATTPAPAPA